MSILLVSARAAVRVARRSRRCRRRCSARLARSRRGRTLDPSSSPRRARRSRSPSCSPTSPSSTPTRSRAAARRASPSCCSARPGVEIIMNGGPGSTSGVFLRGANRDQTLVLIDGLRVVVGERGRDLARGDPARPDRAHRDPARAGVVALRRRRDRRRDPGVHAQGASDGFRVRRERGLRHVRHAHRLGRHARRRRCRCGSRCRRRPPQRRLQRDRRPDATSATTPIATAIDSDDVGANATLDVRARARSGAAVLPQPLDAQFDGGPGFDDRTITTLEAWRVESRNRFPSAGRRGCRSARAATSRSRQTAFGDFPFKTRQRQYAWQNDVDAADRARCRSRSSGARSRSSSNAGFAVTEREHELGHRRLAAAARRPRAAGEPAPRSLDQYGGETTGAIAWGWRFAPAVARDRELRHRVQAAVVQRSLLPGLLQSVARARDSRATSKRALYWSRRSGDVRCEARAVAWHNRVKDLIVFQCDAVFNCLPQNVDDATLRGVTLGLDGDAGATRAQRFARPAGSRGRRDRPPAAAARAPARRRRAAAAARAGAARRRVVASSHRYDDAENLRRLGGYAIVNLTAEWPVGKGVTLLARGDNVGDRNYELASGFATPGAQVFVGVRWQP